MRKKIGDMRHTLPQGVLGPFINDEFGDTFITIYALTGDGFDLARPVSYTHLDVYKRQELEAGR